MTRPVSSPRQMALSQTLKRNVFRKPLEAAPKVTPPMPSPASPADAAGKGVPASAGAKVGRNDPCSCGSGKKFKKCCGA